MPMQHQFLIGVSGYTAFPVIGDPTPARLLPPPVDPKRFVRRHKRKAFASWDEKVRLMQAGSAREKFPDGYGYTRWKTWAGTITGRQWARVQRGVHDEIVGQRADMMIIDDPHMPDKFREPPAGYEYTHAVKQSGLTMSAYQNVKNHEFKTGRKMGRWIDGGFHVDAYAGPPIQTIGNYRRIPSAGELAHTKDSSSYQPPAALKEVVDRLHLGKFEDGRAVLAWVAFKRASEGKPIFEDEEE